MWKLRIYRQIKLQKYFQKYSVLIVLSPGVRLTIIKDLGCWRDEKYKVIAGGQKFGRVTVASCREYAETRGWTVFAMQDGNQCYTAFNAGETYQNFGKSDGCRSNGLGGSWANNVYEIVANQIQTGIKAIRSDL